jgi:uncharacterized protein (TIGR02996 family)
MSTLREALESALVANPDDLASHRAYADWLSEQGDARGEFISVQLALEDEGLPAARRRRLQQREAELLAAHQRQWLGGLAPHLLDDPNLTWRPEGAEWPPLFRFRRGWLEQLTPWVVLLPLARALRDAPEARLLQGLLTDGTHEVRSGAHAGSAVNELARSTVLGNLRRFRLGPDQGDEYENFEGSPHHPPALLKFLKKLPRLEELYLFGSGIDLNNLFVLVLKSLPNLRVLQLYHATQVHRLQLLAERASCRNLTHLLIHPHHVANYDTSHGADEADGYQVYEEGYLPLSVVGPLLHSPNLPSLQHLRLRCSSLGDEGCAEIVASGILKRLKTLDLRHGRITHVGARTLADCPDVRNLQWLDLDRNALTARGVARIRALGIPVRIDNQQTRAEVREGRYLYEGEFE